MEDYRLLLRACLTTRSSLISGRKISSSRCSNEAAGSDLLGVSLQLVDGMQFLTGTRSSVNLGTSLCAFLVLVSLYVLAFSHVADATADRHMLEDMHLSASEFALSMRISATDLQARQALEQKIQQAAFQQFDHHKTGRLYNVSVSDAGVSSDSTFQAIRLRVGSFRKYGVDLKEFSIPRGCVVNPSPERILLVYARLLNVSLFQSLPQELSVVSPVVAVFAYDASNLNSTQQLNKLSITTTSTPISVQIQPLESNPNISCAAFDDNSTGVNYSAPVNNVCNSTHLGAFALVSSTPLPPPPPASAPLSVPPTGAFRRRSNTWKIVVGSVIGGFALLVLVSLLAFGIGKQRKNAKLARMEDQADQGETLQTASIRNSRAPAAGGTRTQPALESDYIA